MRGERARGSRPALAIVLLAIPLLSGAGCEKRDRSNPFDPSNPDSHGVPSLLTARATDHRVDLSWELGGVEGIARVNILRRSVSGGVEEAINPIGIDPSIHAYIDDRVENDTTYVYRLDLELATGGHLTTALEKATPGDAIPWVADSDGGGLTRLTADARHPLSTFGGGLWFLDVAADSARGTIWTAEYIGGTVYEFDSGGGEILERPLAGARAVAVDVSGVWDGSFDTGIVERRRFDGTLAASDTTGGHIEGLFSFRPSEVWVPVVEGRIRIYTEEAGQLHFVEINGFIRPVAVTASGGKAFVLDRGDGSMSRFSLDGNLEARSPLGLLVDPTDLAPDGLGGIWVCDPGRGGLVRFDAAFNQIAYVPIGAVLGVTWDRGSLWVAGGMGVMILDRNGATKSGLSIGPRPIRVAVLHAP